MRRSASPPPPPLVPQRKLVGVATADFGLFADVVAALKQAHIKFVSFDPHQRPPGNVGLILTTTREAHPTWSDTAASRPLPNAGDLPEAPPVESEARWKGCRLLTLDWRGLEADQRRLELELLPFRVRWALAGYPLLRLGIDPGPRPGLALLTHEGLLVSHQAPNEERALAYLLGVLRAAGPGQLLIRVGHGAPLPRNRLVNALMGAAMSLWGAQEEAERSDGRSDPTEGGWVPAGPTPERPLPAGLAIEIVDESGSSSGPRVQSNTAAAALIATLPGYRLRRPLRTHIKPSDIAKVQEHSRRRTQGQRSLSATLAEAVADGQLSLEEALALEGS